MPSNEQLATRARDLFTTDPWAEADTRLVFLLITKRHPQGRLVTLEGSDGAPRSLLVHLADGALERLVAQGSAGGRALVLTEAPAAEGAAGSNRGDGALELAAFERAEDGSQERCDPDGARLLLAAVEATHAIVDRDLLEDARVTPDELLSVRVKGKPGSLKFDASQRLHGLKDVGAFGPDASEAFSDEPAGKRWIVTQRAVQDREASGIGQTMALVCIRSDDLEEIAVELAPSFSPADLIAIYEEWTSGGNDLHVLGQPDQLVTDEPSIASALRTRGYSLRLAPFTAAEKASLEEITAQVEHDLAQDGEQVELASFELDTRAQRERFDAALSRSLMQRALEDPGRIDDAALHYFGCELDEALATFPAAATEAFDDWCACSHRPAGVRQTLAAEVLDEPSLDDRQRAHVRARAEASPRLYRVIARDPGVGVRLLDVGSGAEMDLKDRRLSMKLELDGGAILKLFQSGSELLALAAGPLIRPDDLMPALSLIEQTGVDLGGEVSHRQRHLLGSLWRWAEEERHFTLQEVDREGNTVDVAESVFETRDVQRVVRVLEVHGEILEDRPGASYLWRVVGDTEVSLLGAVAATLEFDAGTLEVSTNSDARMRRVRELLEPIDGVSFLRTTAPERVEASASGHVPTSALDREALAAAEEAFTRAFLSMADLPMPVLGGLSPREAVTTEEGRERVLRWTRTLPRTGHTASNDRDAALHALRKELGLEEA